MNINRRTILLAAGALPFAHMARFAHADQYPSKTIHVVVPASAATSIDVTTRFFSEPLAKRINTPVVAENRPGTGALIPYSGVAKSSPDRHTIMLAGIPMYLLPLLSQGTVTFDPLQDLVHGARVARVPFGLPPAAPGGTDPHTRCGRQGDHHPRNAAVRDDRWGRRQRLRHLDLR